MGDVARVSCSKREGGSAHRRGGGGGAWYMGCWGGWVEEGAKELFAQMLQKHVAVTVDGDQKWLSLKT